MSGRWREMRRDDSGLTLVELLVSIVLISLIGTIVFTSVIATQRASESSRQVNDLNEEARLVLNRMSRELREAKRITAVINPMGPGYNATSDTRDVRGGLQRQRHHRAIRCRPGGAHVLL